MPVTTAATLRAEHASDVQAISDVVAAAFGSQREAELVIAIRASAQFVPELSIVAELDGHVVGHVMISHCTLDDGATHHQIATLSPLAVAPEYQKRGIGSALVREVTTRADRLGESLVVLEGAPSYYSRFGFEAAKPRGIDITLPSWAPPEAAQCMPLSTYDAARRGRVVYPSAFDAVAT